MEGENIYEKIREIFGESPGTLSILQEQVDIDLQMEYFELSKKIKEDLDEPGVMDEKDGLYDSGKSKEEKKNILLKLASLEKVEAYRFIEKYLAEGPGELRNWAILALQESRMLLESKLLDENQVFISTGLGGKGSKLRYFTVLIRRDAEPFPELHRKVIRNELEIMLQRYSAELEKLEFEGSYATMLVVMPLKVPLREVFREAIRECNRYGDFLRANFIITNVRELSHEEIDEFLRNQEESSDSEKTA